MPNVRGQHFFLQPSPELTPFLTRYVQVARSMDALNSESTSAPTEGAGDQKLRHSQTEGYFS